MKQVMVISDWKKEKTKQEWHSKTGYRYQFKNNNGTWYQSRAGDKQFKKNKANMRELHPCANISIVQDQNSASSLFS